MPKKRSTKILLILLAVIFIGVTMLYVVSLSVRTAAYSQLGQVISEQGITKPLGDSRIKGRAECYPPGAGSESCIAFIYAVQDSLCGKIAEALGGDKCGYTQKHFKAHGKNIVYILSNKELTVYLNEGSNLY